MSKSIYLACQPICKPDWLKGNVAVYEFTAEFLRWILDMRQRAVQELAYSPASGFYRAVFYVPYGKWLDSVELHNDLEFDGDWVELAEGWHLTEAQRAQESVPTECWTMGVGADDILFHFYQKQVDQKLETPELSCSDLDAMLQRLEPSPAGVVTMTTESRPQDAEREQRERDLWSIAEHFQQAIDMSDPDHEDFADSGADVVEHLWFKAEFVRKLLAKWNAENVSARVGQS